MAKSKLTVVNQEKPFPLWAKLLLAVVFITYASVFMARQINFVVADLGRHITNGKVTVETGKIISTNFYSYTEPGFEAINHHWGSGVIFYVVHEAFGFEGLSVFYVFTVVGAALLFGLAALRFADARLVFFAAVLAAPLLAYRTEVRPEGISLLFAGVFFYVLVLFRSLTPDPSPGERGAEQVIRKPFLLIAVLCITQLLWVNCHIFFFMGFMLSGFFMVEEFIVVGRGAKGEGRRDKLKHYGILLGVLLIASLLNPFFIKGLLAPLTIFKEYGYMIAENQSVLFMQERMPNTVFTHFEVAGFVLLVLFSFLIIQKKLKQVLVVLLPVVAFGLLGFMAVRGIPLFALASIPAGAFLLQSLAVQYATGGKKIIFSGLSVVAALIVLTGFQSGYATDKKNKRPRAEYKEPSYFAPIKYTTGVGLYADANLSAAFFKQNKIKGPVFNNYDIGGYLIYHLYPKERVFVDNRPEAYSVDFFKKTYVPMQERMEKFREVEQQYGFNCIWFYRHDNTPWAQPFLLQLIEQPDYAPVFVDGFTILFLKRNAQNEELIKKYELPKSMFRSVPG